MLFIRGLINFPSHIKKTAVILGDFDGVHLGHQSVIRKLIAESKKHQLTSVLICFEPQPAEYFKGDQLEGRIFRLREKLQALQVFDLDYILCLGFNEKFARLSADDFIQQVLIQQLHCQRLIVGDDCRLGYQRQGGLQYLIESGKRHNFTVVVEKTYCVKGVRDSSTRIRQALHRGDFDLVCKLMGRSYVLCGKVRRGHHRGKDLGYPTANIPLFHYKMAARGIFVVKVMYDALPCKYGVANLGIRPTFHEHQFALEVYLLDFEGDLYGKIMQVEFLYQLRNEKYFESVEKLKQQMDQDVSMAREYIQRCCA